MDFMQQVASLNAPQQQAVTAESPNLLVLAGAGSGKTRVLVHRMAWLMHEMGVNPSALLAVTFTNKAAREMRHRVEALLKTPTQGLWLGTFHSLAHRFLRAHWRDVDLPQNFQVIDSDDQLRLIKRVLRELQLDEAKWPPRQSQSFINGEKDEGRRPNQSDPGGDLWLKTQLRIYSHYETLCQRSGLVDFGELLLRSHELWLRNPAVLRHYQQRFRHILVDEFQDTNTVQYAWLRMLSGGLVPVTVVGDDDQSIYGWRGAKIENIQRFQDDFAPAELIRLEQNYRSTGTILKAANSVIALNPGRLGKTLWTELDEGAPIDLYSAFNEQDEASFVVDRIRKALADGQRLSEMAILYRSNVQSRVLEEHLVRHQVPYRIYGGLRFYDRLEIKNAVAYLRLIRYREDDAAFERVVNVPPRGLGQKSLDTLRETARDQGIPLYQATRQLLAHGGLKGKAASGVNTLFALLDSLAEKATQVNLPDLVREMLEKTGLLDFHANEKGDKGEARKDNLLELINAVSEVANEGENPLDEFLAQAALDAGEQQAAADQDAVQLMTLHSAKGLEFPTVYLVGMEESLFPHAMALEEAGRLEEERRLCYVGLTRAMKQLVLTHAECRRLYGQDKYQPLSRFVREIPSDLVREVRLRSQISRPAPWAATTSAKSFATAQTTNESGFRLGQRVAHAKFGEGVVLGFEGSGAHQRIQVNFLEQGSKWLILSYAKLENLE
ncbi:MAG: DNA helicase II [Hahellaceae bacterium]|nr:DNA helicase II [Hahellaceae bacterium]